MLFVDKITGAIIIKNHCTVILVHSFVTYGKVMHIRFFPAVKEIDISMANTMTVIVVILSFLLGCRHFEGNSRPS